MRKQRVTACDNFFSTDKEVRCNGRYCDACVERHYQENPDSFSNLHSWICYRCTGRCTCAACKRRRKADEDGDDGIEVVEKEPKILRKKRGRRFSDDEDDDDDDEDVDEDDLINDDDEFHENDKFFIPEQCTAKKAKIPTTRDQRNSGMSALALLAEESLTSEFVPLRNELDSEAIELVKQHSIEISRLKDLCFILQIQIAKMSKQIGSDINFNNC